ncbi:hypothetical protein [Aestuariivirga litoralis]|uniref:hypothetical protein n=1 Tax=Aestuariivirga litoralis TaxID=2650924 RepID=UPI0018C6EA1E|nr:hypothetical protein [Aestuariivirga litoralis]MBG1232990.1 hypothetical protein [Aestuariivirga litoralis]
MSLHTKASAYPRMRNEAYYTPPSASAPMLGFCARNGLLSLRSIELCEPAAGAGHIAKVLRQADPRALATDLHPAKVQVSPVAQLDFLKSSGPSGRHPLGLFTNPPYGQQSELALAFIRHGLDLILARGGFLCLLLPFEFDSRKSRAELLSDHPLYASRQTLGTRVRWINLAQKKHSPMGHHTWHLWVEDTMIRRRIRQHDAWGVL